jgi:signal transduction histidine kinase
VSVKEWPQEIRERRVGGGAASGPEIVLLCGTEEFCQEARRELLRRQPRALVRATNGLQQARALLEREPAQAILAEDVALIRENATLRERRPSLAAALSLLSAGAPLVWIGVEEDAREVASLVPRLEAEFVARSPLSLPAAVSLLERRLRVAGAGGAPSALLLGPVSLGDLTLEGRDFGEVLRHELNNPLTGILGNAELLLLEVRRGRLEMPVPNLQRLEVIAGLAVRMRETVRQLSDRWSAAGGAPGREKQPASEETHWPLSG